MLKSDRFTPYAIRRPTFVRIVKPSRLGALHIAEQSGVPLDHGLLRAAALLHDMYRAVGREHPQKAAQKLNASGYPLLADIISHHHDLGSMPSSEAEILYLGGQVDAGHISRHA